VCRGGRCVLETVAAPHEADPGWARGAFYLGATALVVDLALTTAVVVTNPERASAARNLGGVSVAAFGMTVPIIALGGASARSNPTVTGRPRLRIAGWVGYALTLGDAAWLLLRAHNEVVGDGWVLSVGVLGTLTTVGFTIDAYTSAAQAERLRTAGASRPTIGFAGGSGGGLVPTLGWGGRF
jgi:hypothetical protein